MATTSRRFIPLFALTSLPLVARLVATGAGAFAAQMTAAWRARAEATLPALALVAALLLWRDVRVFPHPLERWTESYLYPTAGLRYLQALGVGDRLLNYYNWGGFIMLHAPEERVFIDGRANTLYDERFYNDYVAMLNGMPGTAERVALYAPDAALLPVGSASLAARLVSECGWQLVYSDGISAVLLPPSSPRLRQPLPSPDAVLGDEPDWQIERAQLATERGDPAAARALAEGVIEKHPLNARAYGALADSYALQNDLRGIAASIERGIAADPRLKSTLRQYEANAYEAARAPQLQLRALEDAVPRGPFSRPEGVLRDIARLRAGVAAR